MKKLMFILLLLASIPNFGQNFANFYVTGLTKPLTLYQDNDCAMIESINGEELIETYVFLYTEEIPEFRDMLFNVHVLMKYYSDSLPIYDTDFIKKFITDKYYTVIVTKDKTGQKSFPFKFDIYISNDTGKLLATFYYEGVNYYGKKIAFTLRMTDSQLMYLRSLM